MRALKIWTREKCLFKVQFQHTLPGSEALSFFLNKRWSWIHLQFYNSIYLGFSILIISRIKCSSVNSSIQISVLEASVSEVNMVEILWAFHIWVVIYIDTNVIIYWGFIVCFDSPKFRGIKCALCHGKYFRIQISMFRFFIKKYAKHNF